MIRRTNGELEQYYEDCVNGVNVIGHELRDELENLMADMQSDRYIYDTSRAEQIIDFIENCLRLTKSPFYGKPFKLLQFQKAFISALYGFRMLDERMRFQRALYLIARKNGKSEQSSAMLLADMITGGTGRDIVCSSNDDAQSSILYDACDTMRLMIDPENVDTWRNQKWLKCLFNNNKIFKISDRTRNKEGRNIDLAVCDEVHEMKDNVIVKSIEQSQSLKENPLLLIITTEGFVNNGFLDEELKRARGIINHEVFDSGAERYLPWLYTQDSEQEVWEGDESNRLWEKSNPSLGKIKKYSYLRQQVDIAKQSKADRAFVLAKDFNIKQSNSTAWLLPDDYNYELDFDLEEFRGSLCLGGVDIAETTDLSCAKVLMMKPDSDIKYIKSMYFIPEGKLDKADDRTYGARYSEWAEKGMVTICKGNYLDTTVIADWFFSLYEDYGLRPYKVGYDVKFSNDFLQRMDMYGFETVMIYQKPEVMSLPMRMMESDLKTRVIAGHNDIDKWCLSNTSMLVNSQGFCMAVKIDGQKGRRIDGAVTEIITYEVYRRYMKDYLENLKG